MKYKNSLSILFLLLVSLLVGACSSDDDVQKASTLSVTQNGSVVDAITFQLSEGNTMLGVSTDADWTVSVPDADTTWLKITPHAGYGWAVNDTAATNTKAYVKVSVTSNDGAQRSSQLTFTAGALTKVVTVTQKGVELDPGDTFQSSYDFVKSIKFGYNLGNTLDSDPDVNTSSWIDFTKGTSAWETAWGQPVTTQAIIDAIIAKGFNVIRIPVSWHAHMDANDRVDAAWMARVKEVVDYVVKAHPDCYCILNVQHDTGAKEASRKDDAGWLYANLDDYPTITKRYQKLWKQIATEFKDYDDHLLFEAFNEILNKDKSWASTPSITDLQAVNKLEQDFVNTVRATGGNNAYRNLVVNPYAASSAQANLDAFTVPQDAHPNHIIVSIHSYDPYWFCNDSNNKDDEQYYIKVFDTSCQTEIDNVFSRISTRCNAMGVPYFFGEFGAIGTHPEMAERVKYTEYMRKKFAEYGTSGLWWSNLYNRSTGVWYEEDLVNALFGTAN